MKKAYLLAIFLLIVPLVLATSTPIAIKAPAGQNITINIVKAENDLPLSTYQVLTDAANEANIIHVSDFNGMIYLTAISRLDGRIYPYNSTNPAYRSANFIAGNAITIDYIQAPVTTPAVTPAPENISNATAETNASEAVTSTAAEPAATETATQSPDTTAATGNSILENIPFKTIGIYAIWVVGAIIVLGILILLITKVAIPYFNNPVRKAEFSGYESVDLKDKNVERDLAKAESKLKEAQAEIDRIRNKRTEVKQAELKFEQAKRELERVKGKS